jgi:ClpP class serine protease
LRKRKDGSGVGMLYCLRTFYRKAVTELLEGKMPQDQAERVAETISSGTWTDDYPLSVREAQALGLTVTTAMPDEVYRLMSLYPQSGMRRSSVEYIPMPYHGWQPRSAEPRAVRAMPVRRRFE